MKTTSKEKVEQRVTVEIIIPTLNEGNTIRQLIHDIRNQKLSVIISILVVDGGSTDLTVKICQEEDVQVIKQKEKGKGNAIREAVEISKADIVVFIDGDGTYSVSDLPSVLEPILTTKAEMVVGTRIKDDREKGSITMLNTMGNNLFNSTINFALKSNVTDSLSGFRALRRETFNDLILFSKNFEIEVEMTVEALAKGYRIIEVPIKYFKRKGGKTKLSPSIDGIKIARTLLFITMNVNPLKFFGIITLCFIGIGIIPATQVIYEKVMIGEVSSIPSLTLSALFFVSAAIALVIGLLSELMVRSRRRIEYLLGKKNMHDYP